MGQTDSRSFEKDKKLIQGLVIYKVDYINNTNSEAENDTNVFILSSRVLSKLVPKPFPLRFSVSPSLTHLYCL